MSAAKDFDYSVYLRSEAWAVRRQWKLDAADHRCQVCNDPHKLEVHHRTYDRVGNEREADLIVLCEDCHHRHHGIQDKPPAAELPRNRLDIIPDPLRWGEHSTRVAEINRELRFADAERAALLLSEKSAIARVVVTVQKNALPPIET